VLEAIKSAIAQLDREAWIRFFLALGGLSLAFVAAIFSSVTREAGNLLGTAILASLALLVAGAVALTTVPYLARRVALERVKDSFDYDVTREGMFYMAMVLLIAVAALNTGNNLLFIVLSAMLAAILISGVASAMVLRRLVLEVGLPQHIFAGTAAAGRFTLRNPRRWAPSFSVSVTPPPAKKKKGGKRWRWERSTFAFPSKRPPERQWVRWPDLSLRAVQEGEAAPAAGIFQGNIYFPYLPARNAATAEVELNFARRGRYVQEGFAVATRFPFSFLVKTRRLRLEREVIVFPSVEPTDEFFEVLPLITGEFESFVRGRGYDLYRIREYTQEDSARHLDWKATAKSGSPKVREFTREDERKLRIVFDNPQPGAVTEEDYEQAVALAASLGWHFAGEDTDLSFAAPGYQGGRDIYDFLAYLALVGPAATGWSLEQLQVTDDYNVILTARARGSIPTRLWECSYFVFMEEAKKQAAASAR
jgi:uncharacterized protein (DUF58 family)